jgi:hypothetical protein
MLTLPPFQPNLLPKAARGHYYICEGGDWLLALLYDPADISENVSTEMSILLNRTHSFPDQKSISILSKEIVSSLVRLLKV